MSTPSLNRRLILRGALGATASVVTGMSPALAALLSRTPGQSAGPFYPARKPLDKDNDLAQVAGRPGRAKGDLLHISGRVLDTDGRAVTGSRVEIWQTNTYGRYDHPRDSRDAPLDPDFQGFGADTVAADGSYWFRTIKPAPYPASADWMRPPHVHFAVFAPGAEPFITQMYFAGDPLNARDRLLNGVGDPSARARLVVALENPPPDLEPGSRVASFDIVLGKTPPA